MKIRTIDFKSYELPVICVPITRVSHEDIVADVRAAIKENVKMIEIRLDFFEGIYDRHKVRRLFDDIRKVSSDVVLLATIRTVSQGGQVEIDKFNQVDLVSMYRSIIDTHAVDILDVEFYTLGKIIAKKIALLCHNSGVKAIASNHYFDMKVFEDEGRDREGFLDVLCEMSESESDFVKLAIMPRDEEDVTSLLAATDSYAKSHEDGLVITMAMGVMGQDTRINGYKYGSCLTFAALFDASAPGQVRFDELQNIYGLNGV